MKAKRMISIFLVLTLAFSLAGSALAGQVPDEITITETEDRTVSVPESYDNPTESAESLSEVADETVTLMVYMVGSNLESDDGAASADMIEILTSGVDTSRCNVLIFTGGSTRWYSNVSSKYNSIYLLEESGLHKIYSTEGLVDMGQADTLSEFLRFGYNEYPADHYALILWDHGGGPLGGFGSDENFRDIYGYDDVLYADELAAALEESPFGGSVRFDWVGYDACLMANIETAVMWSDYADYLIASEESEEGYGWDYSFLSILNETVDPEEIGSAALDSFEEFYEEIRTWYSNPDYTLSCLDLSMVSDVMDSLSALSAAMAQDVSESFENYISLANIRKEVTRFAPDVDPSYDLVDLGDLADRLEALYPDLADDLSESLSELVCDNRANIEGATGISIYYPYDNKEIYPYLQAEYASLGMPESYLEYLSAFSDNWTQEGIYSALSADTEELSDENEIVIQLSEEQLATLADASYTVLIDSSSILGESNGTGLYTPVMVNQSIEPDENGQLHIPMNVDLLFFRDTEASPWIAQQIVETDQYVEYITLDSYLGGASVFSYFDKLPVQVRIRIYKESGNSEIVGVSLLSDEGSIGKSTVFLTDYNSLGRTVTGYIAEDYVPYTEWEEYDVSRNLFVDFSSAFQISLGTSETVIYPVVCQVLLEDVSGEISASRLIDLNWNEQESITVSIGDGEMEFTNLGGALSLDSYTGTDTEVDIPAQIDGIPVTKIEQKAFSQNDTLQSVTIPGSVSEIRWEAFYSCENLESVVLNEGLERIAEGAFANCPSMTTINIPASVTEIGLAAFAGCDELIDLTIADGNQNYRMQDGFILSSDGSVLVSYTAAVGDYTAPWGEYTFSIPDGVKEIADGAFAYCVADQIIFPEGLESIGNYAFYMCLWMQAPEFPDSLTDIGNYAFNMGYYEKKYDSTEVFYNETREDLELPDPMPVEIGENLLYISETAFSNDIYSEFIVDPANPYYSSVDGDLANKAGDYIICTAYREGESQEEITRTQYMGIEFTCPDGYEYETDEDGAYLDYYDSGELTEELMILVGDPEEGEALTGTTQDYELLQNYFQTFGEGFDDVSFTQSEIEVAGCAALYYSGEVSMGSDVLGYDLVLVANPYDQCVCLITRAYLPDSEHMTASEFQQFLETITFTS